MKMIVKEVEKIIGISQGLKKVLFTDGTCIINENVKDFTNLFSKGKILIILQRNNELFYMILTKSLNDNLKISDMSILFDTDNYGNYYFNRLVGSNALRSHNIKEIIDYRGKIPKIIKRP